VRRLLDESKMPLKAILDCLIKAPREILRLTVPSLEIGAQAELTFFNTDETWTYQQKHIKSKSINTPYLGEQFKGRAVGIYNRSLFVQNSL